MTQQTPASGGAASPDSATGSPRATKTPLYAANHASRYQRQTLIRQVQDRTGRFLICYVSGIQCVIDENDTMPFVDLLHKIPTNRDLDLLLHTTGGSIDAAEKLMGMMRRHVDSAKLRIIVPDFAKSAGTLMVLGADSVVMSDMSELGPIDPQARLWVRLFFVEDFSPYSWALLPANASLQWPFRGGRHQAGQRVPASFRQPAEPRHGAEHLRSSPRQARSLLDIRAAFWYGAVGREADLRWL